MENRRASDWQAANSKSAGINLRRVRSPDAPKITIAQGSATATELRASRAVVSAMSFVIEAMRSSSCKGRSDATFRQRSAQLFSRLEENRAHTQGFRRFQVRGTVVYENALFRSALRDSQRKLIDERVGLADSQIARSEKASEVPGQVEFTDAVNIQLFRFVVQSGQEVPTAGSQFVEQSARLFVFARLRKDEAFELIPGEGPLAEEHRSVQIRFEGDLPGFELDFSSAVPFF